MEAPIMWVWVVYFIFVLIIATWNYNRGNSLWVGLLISAFFTPIVGFILVVITKKRPEVLEQRKLKAGEMKKCPKCGELIRSEATRCRYCQADF